MNLFEEKSEYIPDNLFAGNEVPVLIENVTIAKGQALKRGAVIGIITESGLGQMVKSSATDGSKVPYAVLSDDIDTTENGTNADTDAEVYISGYFNSSALIVTNGETIETYKNELRKLGIFIK
mgnify:CR=1 FL=1